MGLGLIWSDLSLRDFVQSVQSVALCPLSLHKEPMIYLSVLQTHRCSGEVKQRFQAYELNQKIYRPDTEAGLVMEFNVLRCQDDTDVIRVPHLYCVVYKTRL